MNITKRFLAILVGILVFLLPQTASAHVLVPDLTGKTGAILHVGIDDNPVAGQLTGLFYDVHTDIDLSKTAPILTVTDPVTKARSEVSVAVQGQHLVHGAYNFPSRGLYELDLTINPTSVSQAFNAITFSYYLRVSAGPVAVGQTTATAPGYAVVGFTATIWLFVLLIIIWVKRRKIIVNQGR